MSDRRSFPEQPFTGAYFFVLVALAIVLAVSAFYIGNLREAPVQEEGFWVAAVLWSILAVAEVIGVLRVCLRFVDQHYSEDRFSVCGEAGKRDEQVRHELAKRRNKLVDDLRRATAPSDEPDERYRPTHWSDRLYYLVHSAGALTVLDEINWDAAAGYICFCIARSACAHGSMIKIEAQVAIALAERFGTGAETSDAEGREADRSLWNPGSQGDGTSDQQRSSLPQGDRQAGGPASCDL